MAVGKDEEKMNIVYTFTHDFAEKAKPSIKSLLEHNPKAKIFIITDGKVDLPYETIDVSKQEWFPKDSVNYHNYFTYINLLKVCYPSLLTVNKVIHMDCDTIVCDSLEPLWKTDVKGKWFAACPEYQGHYKPFGDLYYNMGVALINLQQMRKDSIQDKLVEYLNAFKQPWADQDAWNYYALESGKHTAFPIRFNECFCTGRTAEPAIVHYCGIPDWWDNKTMDRRDALDRYR